MTIEIDIKYNDVFSEDGYMSDMSDCYQSKKLEINFKFGIEIIITFFVSKLDKKTFKKLVKILKNTPIFDWEDELEDKVENILFLIKNGNSLYNKITNDFIFRFDNSKNHSIIYNPNKKEISFFMEDGQYCKICNCEDCKYYSKFSPSANIKLPFNDDTKDIILNLFNDIIKIIDKV